MELGGLDESSAPPHTWAHPLGWDAGGPVLVQLTILQSADTLTSMNALM